MLCGLLISDSGEPGSAGCHCQGWTRFFLIWQGWNCFFFPTLQEKDGIHLCSRSSVWRDLLPSPIDMPPLCHYMIKRWMKYTGMKKYRDEGPLELKRDPLSWWKENQQSYPLLSNLAQNTLCIPGTSVASERVFSTAGDLVTAQRITLTPEHVDQLLFLNKNL